jgi:hypothetical protein
MTKQEHIDQAVASMFEVPSSTRVKGWGFKFMDEHYLVICYWMQSMGDCIAVFPANKKGKRSTQKWVAAVDCCKDPVKGIVALADLLIKDEEETS